MRAGDVIGMGVSRLGVVPGPGKWLGVMVCGSP